MIRMRVLFWGLFLGAAASALAATEPYFVANRKDVSVPPKCLPFQFSYFKTFDLQNPPLMTISIEGAHKRGFTHEYPLTRSDATTLWSYFKETVPELDREHKSECELRMGLFTDFSEAHQSAGNFDSLFGHFLKLESAPFLGGFEFHNEGDVLEALAPYAKGKDGKTMRETFPADRYFITGGLEYHEGGGRTVGELDVVVADKQTCQVASIGEAKLGVKSLPKAKEQLGRFVSFLKGMARP